MIWKVRPAVEEVNNLANNQHMAAHLGIEITEIGDDFIAGRMPVDHRTKQPLGLLHGGASCAFAETLASVGGAFCIDLAKQIVVGLEINANHLRGVKQGHIYGIARPLHIGKLTQVWEIKITNESKQLVCVSRLTLVVRDV